MAVLFDKSDTSEPRHSLEQFISLGVAMGLGLAALAITMGVEQEPVRVTAVPIEESSELE
jgi:hypothetical protein